MLSNAYFLAKFRFDTAENEPAKNLKKFKICKFWRALNLARYLPTESYSLYVTMARAIPRVVRCIVGANLGRPQYENIKMKEDG